MITRLNSGDVCSRCEHTLQGKHDIYISARWKKEEKEYIYNRGEKLETRLRVEIVLTIREGAHGSIWLPDDGFVG